MRMDWSTFHFVMAKLEGGYKLNVKKDILLYLLSVRKVQLAVQSKQRCDVWRTVDLFSPSSKVPLIESRS